MLECEISVERNIATVMLQKTNFGFSKFMTFDKTMTELEKISPHGILFDASHLKRISHGMLAGIVEGVLRLERKRAFRPFAMAIGVCALPEKSMAWARAQGLDRVLPLFLDKTTALGHSSFKSLALHGSRGVILCAHQGAQLAPLTRQTTVGMLDFLGRPILERIIDHASGFGVRNFVVNPGFCGHEVSALAQRQTKSSVFCVNEESWQRAPTNDVATIARLQSAHGVFADDTIILQSNVLSNVDLAALMNFHRETEADATIGVGQGQMNSSFSIDRMHGKGTFSAIVLSPRAAEGLTLYNQKNSEAEVIAVLRALRMNIQFLVSDHNSASIKCGADYYACQAAVLENGIFDVTPDAEQIAPKRWVADTAQVSRSIEFRGPCFVGSGSKLARGSIFKGTNIVGKNSIVQKNSVIANSVLMSQTQIHENTFVDHMIADSEWAVNHKFADGSIQNRARMVGVSSVLGSSTKHAKPIENIVKIA